MPFPRTGCSRFPEQDVPVFETRVMPLSRTGWSPYQKRAVPFPRTLWSRVPEQDVPVSQNRIALFLNKMVPFPRTGCPLLPERGGPVSQYRIGSFSRTGWSRFPEQDGSFFYQNGMVPFTTTGWYLFPRPGWPRLPEQGGPVLQNTVAPFPRIGWSRYPEHCNQHRVLSFSRTV